MSESLASNSSLTTLNLDGNLIGASGSASLQFMLEKNYTLTSFTFDDNGFDPITTGSLKRLVNRNCSFSELRKAFSSEDLFVSSQVLLSTTYKKQSFLDAFPVESLLECSLKGGNTPGFIFLFTDCVQQKKRFPLLKSVPSLLQGENDAMLLQAVEALDNRFDVSAIHNETGDSLLHWIVGSSPYMRESTALKIVRLLLDRGCDPNEHSARTGVTPLLLTQSVALLDELLDRDADFGACDLSGCGVDSYFTTELLEHMRMITERREFHKSSQDYIVGVFGSAMGCRALPGTFYSAPEQVIAAIVTEIHKRNSDAGAEGAPSKRNAADATSQGPWWSNNDSCPQRMPLGCFPMVRMFNGRLQNNMKLETPRRMSCADRSTPVLRVCDFDRLSTTVSLPVNTIVMGVISSDTPEQNRIEFWNSLRASLQKVREKNSDVKAIFLCLDSRSESSVTSLLKQKGTKHIPSSDLMFHARLCGFDAYAEIATSNLAENLLALIDNCMALHCKNPPCQPAPERSSNAKFTLRKVVPYVVPPPADESHIRPVKVLVVNQQNARIGPQQVIDNIFDTKKHPLLRVQRASALKRHASTKSSHSPIKRYVEMKRISLPERPTVAVHVYAFSGTFDITERLLLEQFMSQQDTLYILCINLSDNNCIDTFRDWLEFLENHPNGPSSSSKLLVLCSFFSNVPSSRSVNPPWKFCQESYDRVRGALKEWAANTKIPSSIIQVCDKKIDGKKSIHSVEDLNSLLSRLAIELSDNITRTPPFFYDIVHCIWPAFKSGGRGATASSSSSSGSPGSSASPSPSPPASPSSSEPLSPSKLSMGSMLIPSSEGIVELANVGMASRDTYMLTAEMIYAKLPANVVEKIEKLPNPLFIIEESLYYLHKTGCALYFHGQSMTKSIFHDPQTQSESLFAHCHGGVACVNPWEFVNAFETLFSSGLDGCLTFEKIRNHLLTFCEDFTNEQQVAQFIVMLQACGLCTVYTQPTTLTQVFVIPSLCKMSEQSAFMICEMLPLPKVDLLHCKCISYTCSSCHLEFNYSDMISCTTGTAEKCPNCKSLALIRRCSKNCKHCTKRSGKLELMTEHMLVQSTTDLNVTCLPFPRKRTTSSYSGSCGSVDYPTPLDPVVLPKNLVHCKRCFDSLKSEGNLVDDPYIGSCFFRVVVLNTDYTFSALRLLSMLASRYADMLLVDGFTPNISRSGIAYTSPSYAIFSDVFGNIVTLWVECQVPFSAPKERALSTRAMLCSNMDLTVFMSVKGFAPLRALETFQLSFLGTVEPVCPHCAVLFEDYKSRLICPVLPLAAPRPLEGCDTSSISSSSASTSTDDVGSAPVSPTDSGDSGLAVNVPPPNWTRPPEVTYVCLAQRHQMTIPVFYPKGLRD